MRKVMASLGLAIALGACTPAGPPTVGDEAPAFDLTTVSGDSVALEDFRGKPVLLYFHMAVG
jgi:cytochrome oxidase Cu insertion factor (SCO1/SenC/PrrC family)